MLVCSEYCLVFFQCFKVKHNIISISLGILFFFIPRVKWGEKSVSKLQNYIQWVVLTSHFNILFVLYLLYHTQFLNLKMTISRVGMGGADEIISRILYLGMG